MKLAFTFSLQEAECLWELNTAAISELVKTRDKQKIFLFLCLLKTFCRAILFWDEVIRS